MEQTQKKVVSIYLEDWQRRLVKDAMHEDHTILELPVDDPKIVRYGNHEAINPATKRMYFTGWQMKQIRDETGAACNFIEIPSAANFRYGVPPK